MAKNMKKKLGKFEVPGLSNASKTLLANIRFASIDERVKTIVVTSSLQNEGKTAVATNLALAIATSGKKVLIVVADMRRRSLAQLLDLHPANGLYSVLSGSATLNETIVPTNYPNLYFMDSEPNIPSPPDILSTKRFSALVDNLRDTFDYVIFDTPPVSLFVDSAIIGNLVDGALFVIRQGYAKRSTAVKCVQQMNAANARVLGTVMTFCEEDESSYYYAYYTQDGKRVDKNKSEYASTLVEINNTDLNTWSRQAGVVVAPPSSNAGAGKGAGSGSGAAGASGGVGSSSGSGNSGRFGGRGGSSSGGAGSAGSMGSAGAAGRTVNPAGSGNPYAAGSFKAGGTGSTGRRPRHKNTRL